MSFTAKPAYRVGVEESFQTSAGVVQRGFVGNGRYWLAGAVPGNFTATGALTIAATVEFAYTVRYTVSSVFCEEIAGRTVVTQFQIRSVDVNPATTYTMNRAAT
ncbi:hypothetical protein [Streptomyces sp. NPDC127084]|uniref:hypothetical protein n=1 Tax=Streptomyces sp. NPDC127084 TaxID=3347133 RepID=UPI00364F7C37